jgi:hypothetical protein
MTISRELSRYKLDLVGNGTDLAGEYIFLYRNGNENHELGKSFFLQRESYQQLRGLSLLVVGRHT